MRPAISSDLLLRLMNATPEQYAAVEQVLSSVIVEHPASVSEDVARAAFALLVKLDARGKQKSPTPMTVFRLYCIEGLSADQVAAKCRCAKGTVMSRLRFIEQVTHTKPEQFRAMSGHLQRIADDYDSSGAREIYRRGLAQSVPDGPEDED
ncbi:MAG: hypothetical protein P4N60_11525 [Verrucomicrobiae bacterium]|nr:hypothetical protein [Verrucomicrobiae bacterium]